MDPTPTSYLSLSSSTVMVAVSLLFLAMAIGLGYWNWTRSHFRRGVLLLEGVRLTAIAGLLFLLHQPEWTTEYRPAEKPNLVVLIDRSRSMETQDVLNGAASGEELQSRTSVARSLESPEYWSSVSDRFQVSTEGFPSIAAGDATGADASSSGGTNIHDALEGVLGRESNVQAVVLISDGDWNRGKPPVELASRFRSRGIPIFSVPIGSETRLPDLEAISLDAPTFGVAGKSLRIPFTIESSLSRDHVVQVSVEFSNGETETKEVRVRPMSRTTDFVSWTPKEPGDYTIRVAIPPHPDERLRENNSIAAPISIRQEKLRVLLIETSPRWEYRYLRNALSRDPGVEVACLLLHPLLEKPGGGNRDYISEFPSDPEELAQYDVVFLGDIGIAEKQLTEEQCQQLRGLVEYQATGLVFLPGSMGHQSTLLASPLDPLLPVLLDEKNPAGTGSKLAMHLELTESGRRSLLTKLADTEEDNLQVWSGLPGFQWFAPVLRAKAGTETLAVHQESANEFGRVPLIVTKTFGAGKVLYMGTDGAWRWRRGVEDRYHYRFWGQVVRWMAYQRNMAKGETIRFYYSPDSPALGQRLMLKANVMSDSGEPLSAGTVTAKIDSPAGRSTTLTLQSAGADSWGLFEGSYDVREVGKHRVLIASSESAKTLEAEFFVQGSAEERVGLAAKPKVLQELSKVTQGESISIDRVGELGELLLRVPDPPLVTKRWQLWAHPIVMTVLIGLLSAFWIGRKWLGML
ncbi:hypothetical protein SH467x_004123 [Pirellulaceae bacterium SH467]